MKAFDRLKKQLSVFVAVALIAIPAALATYDVILPVVRGGTGATTASGARTNLGAAASGANSDITSLSALSTPLSAPQGGTGFGSYTTGDLLYASSTSALSKLVATTNGFVLTLSAGLPVWAAATFGARTVTFHTAAATAVVGFDSNDATTAAYALTLPAAASNTGKEIIAKKTDATANAVTVTRAGADTIDGATTYVLSAQYQSVTLISDGTNWNVE